MHDPKNIEEVSATISRGLLAGDVVIAVDKSLTGAPLSAQELAAIDSGRNVLMSFEDPDVPPARPLRSRHLASSKNVLDALQIARTQTLDESLQQFIHNATEALSAARQQQMTDAQRPYLESVRSLFAYLAQLNLAQANDITRSRRNPLKWPSRLSLSS
jgi:hypothetical protein